MNDWYQELQQHLGAVLLFTKQVGGMVSIAEIVRSLVVAGITAIIVGYGTIRVIENEQLQIRSELTRAVVLLDALTSKVNENSIEIEGVVSERTVRKSEIDRRLDALERVQGLRR